MKIQEPGTGRYYELYQAAIAAASSGDNTLRAAVAGYQIRVISGLLIAAAAVTVRFESGAGGDPLTGQIELAANSGWEWPENRSGHIWTNPGELLNLELSGAISVAGSFTYILT